MALKCQFCSESYCSDHFRPAAHQCVKYTSTDRVAPPCPLCQTPVCKSDLFKSYRRSQCHMDPCAAIKPNEDPNDAMEAHFSTSCTVMIGNDAAANAKSKTPRCSRNRCEKVLYTPITCDVSISSRVLPLPSASFPPLICVDFLSSSATSSFAQRIVTPIPTNVHRLAHRQRLRRVLPSPERTFQTVYGRVSVWALRQFPPLLNQASR